jgi:hypothetical protein
LININDKNFYRWCYYAEGAAFIVCGGVDEVLASICCGVCHRGVTYPCGDACEVVVLMILIYR